MTTWIRSTAFILLLGAVATPAISQEAGDQATTTDTDREGFDDWGLLGLLGLAGLMGRQRNRDVVEPRRT